MTMTNAFIIYEVLFGRIHKNDPNLNRHLQKLTMHEAVFALCHHLVQTGPSMRSQKAEHPLPTRDMTRVFDVNTGRSRRSDAKLSFDNFSNAVDIDNPISGQIGSVTPKNVYKQRHAFKEMKRKYPWHQHQSICTNERKPCHYKLCLGSNWTHL